MLDPVSPSCLPTAGGTVMAWYDGQLNSALWHLYSIGLDRIRGEYSGNRVRVGIFDDGVQSDHPALIGSYNTALDLTLAGSTLNDTAGLHGTAVAGLIAAHENDSGAIGVATGAQIAGVNIFDGPGATSLTQTLRLMKRFDVVNNSWGSAGCYSDGPHQTYGIGDNFQGALNDAVQYGRRGLGTVIVNAAGNDWTFDRRDANTSAFNQDRHTVTVGAISDAGQVASYSTRGASLLVSAPSSGGSQGITTTDLAGEAGYDPGDQTSTFGGTSAATPIVSGVVALMLEANPSLGWRDVQDILAYSADRVGPSLSGTHAFAWTTNRAKTFNGGGLHFSNDVGFGKVDAYTAVRMAEVWSLLGRPQTSRNEAVVKAAGSLSKVIADSRTTSFAFTVSDAVDLEHVDLSLALNHGDISQLKIQILSPNGTASTLLSPGGDKQRVSNWTWTFGSDAFRGESAKGVWTVRVTDTAAGATGAISGFDFKGFGDKTSPNDVYHFTDEFAALAHANASRAVVVDQDGGSDWLDLVGLAEDLHIDLRPRARSYVGGEATFVIARDTSIENAVTGDGNDVIRGNALNNRLYGMRGDDRLQGGPGSDILNGGAGSDTADYMSSPGAVHVDLQVGQGWGGDAQGDVLRGIENVVGSRFNDVLIGSSRANKISGGLGADKMVGGGGDDTYSVDNRGDCVSEKPGEGYDRIYTSISYALTDSSEVEMLAAVSSTSTNPLSLYGNKDDNLLVGNAGDNLLDGRGGADVMKGLKGNDTYLVDSASDQVVEMPGEGNDVVIASVSYALQAGSEIEVLRAAAGSAAINLTGNEFSHTLIGNDGDNVLKGGQGNDVVIGGGGVDAFAFSASLGATNIDTVMDFTPGVDRIWLDHTAFDLPLGTLDPVAFATGPDVSTAAERIVYEAATGALYFDSNDSATTE